MTALRAVLRVEWRFLRGDLVCAGALLLAASVAGLCEEADGAPHLLSASMWGGLLFAVVLIAVMRSIRVDACWATWEGVLPLQPARLALGRILLWSVPALWLALAYAIWTTGPPFKPWAHVITIWLWLLLARTVGRGVRTAARGSFGVLDAMLLAGGLLALAGTAPDVASGSDPWVSLRAAPWLLGVAWAAGFGWELHVHPEWLPTQSPKPLRRRARRAGNSRIARPLRTPGVVLSRVAAGTRSGEWEWTQPLASAYVGFLGGGVAPALFQSLKAPLWAAGAVLCLGSLATFILREVSTAWALLRAYPIPARRVWAAGTGPALMALIAGFFAGWLLVAPSLGARILADGVFGRRSDVPLLYTPAWLATPHATRERPRGMPAPFRGFWPLRRTLTAQDDWGVPVPVLARGSTAIQRANEPAYFRAALHYYLYLVHGIHATDEELIDALGAPLTLRFRHAYVVDPGDTWAEEPGGVAPPKQSRSRPVEPIKFYFFTRALQRLERTLGARLQVAAWRLLALDLALVLLSVLLFVRLALLDGPLRFTLPVLALPGVALWMGSRPAALHLALRDAVLARPGVAALLGVVVAILLVRSIKRRLSRAVPRAAGP